MYLEDYIRDLPPEVQEKARACRSLDELLALAEEQGVPVPDDKLETVAGGKKRRPKGCGEITCPKCGSTSLKELGRVDMGSCVAYHLQCKNCGEAVWIYKY